MDYFDILLAKKLSGGGGGEITVEGLNVEENGTYTAPSGKAYSPVVVNLPLGEKSITANGEYLASADDLKGFSKVTVNVAGFTKKAMPTGAISSFNDGTANPLTKLKIAINPVQAGSGDPSPTNPRAISGWTGANIHIADGETPHIIDNVVNISWQTEVGTVYGGELDVTTGVLTVKNVVKTCDGSEDWRDYPSRNGFYLNISEMEVLSGSENTKSNWLKNSIGWTEDTSAHFGAGNTVVYALQVTNNISEVSSVETWKTYLSNNNLQLYYPLANPLTYQLTPTQVSSILGTNNRWADTGDILEGEYFTNL